MRSATWINENRVSKHFVISLNFPSLSLFTVLFAYVVFLVVLWLGIYVEVAVEGISRIRFLSNPFSLPRRCFPVATQNHLCLTQVTYIYLKSVRVKLVSVPFSSLYFVIGNLEKSFPRMHHVIPRFAESASSNIVLYSRFIRLNGSITLIRAETERYDIVRGDH